MSQIIENNETEKDFKVSLPQNIFADIIVNFLGKKETISFNSDNTPFVIDLNEIKQFYFLLSEKLEKEQNSRLSVFYVSIGYDDKTVRTINTFDSLDKFYETKYVSVISITLSWHIVQQFPNSEILETQKIDLSFITSNKVSLNIDYTNKSWANEVELLFKEQIKKIVLPVKKINNFIKIETLLYFQAFIIVINVMIIIFIGICLYTENNNLENSMYDELFANKNRELFYDFDKINTKTKEEKYKEKNKVLMSLYQSKISEKELIIYLGILNNFGSLTKVKEYNEFSHIISNNKINNIYKEYIKKLKSIETNYEKKKDERFKYHRIQAADNFFNFTRYFIIILSSVCIIRISISSFISYHKQKSFILITSKSEKEYKKFKKDKRHERMTYGLESIFFVFLSGILINIISSFILN